MKIYIHTHKKKNSKKMEKKAEYSNFKFHPSSEG